jgi:uncharacterized damage-inducible protein DinB
VGPGAGVWFGTQVIWHLMEHDAHHGGAISLCLGTHDLPGLDL